jgi:hypothetical protein
MAKNLDLNKIKDEIDSRKKERNMVSSRLGENVGRGVAPRDEFLHGLLTSLHTGKETPSSTLIKVVENKVATKHGEIAKHNVNEAPVQQRPAQQQYREQVDMSPERDELLFIDLEKKRKQTLAESIENFSKIPQVGAPMNNNVPQYSTNNNGLTSPMLNEAYLVENVKKVVDGYLSENLAPIFEEAIKSTIIEMYAVERIKEVLTENREMIRTVVIETIREIQAKSKAKAQS